MWEFWVLVSLMILLALSFIAVPLLRVTMPKIQFFYLNSLLIFLPITALILYFYIGNSAGLKLSMQMAQQKTAVNKLRQELKTPEAVITALKQHLEQDPSSAKGWYLLGKIYLSIQQLDPAVEAFARGAKLDPQNPEVLFQYAQALYLKQHSLTGLPHELLHSILAKDPHNSLAINLLAVDAYQQKNYQQAIQYWEQILPNFPAESPDAEALLKAIAKAQAALGNLKNMD